MCHYAHVCVIMHSPNKVKIHRQASEGFSQMLLQRLLTKHSILNLYRQEKHWGPSGFSLLCQMLANFSVNWHLNPHTFQFQCVTVHQDEILCCYSLLISVTRVSGHLSFTFANQSKCSWEKKKVQRKFVSFPSIPEPTAGLLSKMQTGTSGLALCPC